MHVYIYPGELVAQKDMHTLQSYNGNSALTLPCARNSRAEEVQKAFRRLALKLHPDKNKAPGAEEAFKKVNIAVQSITSGGVGGSGYRRRW